MAIFFIAAGTNHFFNPAFYLAIIPPALPAPRLLNALSGAAEILLGALLLIPGLSRFAAWGLIVLLLVVFPANIYHFTSGGAGMDVPQWLLAARLPIQFVLIAWAYWHTS
jgi:uncharacterized membrane protein